MGGQTHRLAVHERVKQERRLKEGESQSENLRDPRRRLDTFLGGGHRITHGRGGGAMGRRCRIFSKAR